MRVVPEVEIAAPTPEERNFGAAAHVGSFAGSVIPLFGGFVVTLLVWWWMRGSAFVERHARASINFQLSMTVWYGLALGYLFVSVGFGLLLVLSSAVFETVSIVAAARRAKAGKPCRYRLCLEFVRQRGAR